MEIDQNTAIAELTKTVKDMQEVIGNGTFDEEKLEKALEAKVKEIYGETAAERHAAPPEPTEGDEIVKRYDLKEGKTTILSPTSSEEDTFKNIEEPARAIASIRNVKRTKRGNPVFRVEDGERVLQYHDEKIASLQKLHDQLFLVHSLMSIAGPSSYRSNPERAVQGLKTWAKWEKATSDIKANLTGATALVGSNWVPTGFSSEMVDAAFVPFNVPQLFRLIEMPTSPNWTVPTNAVQPTANYIATSGTAPSADEGLQTRNVTMTARLFKGFHSFTDEITEDSIIAIADYVMMKLAESLGRAEETAIINGDTASSHQDGHSGQDARLAYLGLRAMAVDQSLTSTTASNENQWPLDSFLDVLALLGAGYKEIPADNAWIVPSVGAVKLLNPLTATSGTEVQTVDKLGPNAPLVTGQVFSLYGRPVILSGLFPENLQTDGLLTGGSSAEPTDRTGILCVHRDSFWRGNVRNQMMETDYAPRTGLTDVVVSMRRAFRDIQEVASGGADQAPLGYGYNFST